MKYEKFKSAKGNWPKRERYELSRKWLWPYITLSCVHNCKIKATIYCCSLQIKYNLTGVPVGSICIKYVHILCSQMVLWRINIFWSLQIKKKWKQIFTFSQEYILYRKALTFLPTLFYHFSDVYSYVQWNCRYIWLVFFISKWFCSL